MTFDEQEIVDYIQAGLKKAFNTKEWKTLFGGKKIAFSEDNFGQAPSFPIIYVDIDDCHQADGTNDSSHLEKFTQFYFNVECYNQATAELSKKALGRKINARVVEVLREIMNPNITSNSELASPDETIYRRSIQGYSVYDNTTKTFYR